MEKNEQDKKVSRRQFFGIAWTLALIAAGAQALVGLRSFLTPILEAGAFGTVVKAGRVDEFELPSVNYFREARFYLVRNELGFLALYRKCTHLGCVVPWDAPANEFNCPCHSSLFTREGAVISGPAPRPMDMFPVTIKDDIVFVDTGQVVERTAVHPEQITPV
ncbi:MAG: Rieske 2Fe-2S domain-containing protein [Chloroflexota bacterium]|nr:Rieske 2Fe-2S domain-containing protein [Chloroflexota bacterium]